MTNSIGGGSPSQSFSHGLWTIRSPTIVDGRVGVTSGTVRASVVGKLSRRSDNKERPTESPALRLPACMAHPCPHSGAVTGARVICQKIRKAGPQDTRWAKLTLPALGREGWRGSRTGQPDPGDRLDKRGGQHLGLCWVGVSTQEVPSLLLPSHGPALAGLPPISFHPCFDITGHSIDGWEDTSSGKCPLEALLHTPLLTPRSHP